jgi:hypothetical protein
MCLDVDAICRIDNLLFPEGRLTSQVSSKVTTSR